MGKHRSKDDANIPERCMRIGIDARPLQISWHKVRGLGRYTQNLIKSLLEIDNKNEYFLFVDKSLPLNLPLPMNKVNLMSSKLINRFHRPKTLRKELFLPAESLFRNIDIFHFTTHLDAPFWHPCKTVVTVHDLIPLVFPREYIGYLTYEKRFHLKQQELAVRRADMVITISHTSKRDVIKYYGIKHKKIVVINEGVDTIFHPMNDLSALERLRLHYKINKPFILYVGGTDYRKNFKRMLTGFSHYKRKSKDKIILVIVGQENVKETGKLKKEISKLGIGNEVFWTGFVSNEDLVLFYNTAELFLFPTLYEGFGLPALEAMACGTPVIISNTSSLSEVAGNAALLIDPYNIEEMAESIERVLTDAKLRNSLIKKGFKQVQNFSWKKTAKETLNVYRMLV